MTETTSVATQVFRQLGRPNDRDETARYVAVTGNGVARWLLPAGRSKLASLLASWRPYRLRSRVAWNAVRAACTIGALAQIPGMSELEVECPRAADWTALGWSGSEAPAPVVYLGTLGPQRKAVVHLVEQATGKCQAVVKVPLTDQAKIAVVREAEVLGALEAEDFESAPRLLYLDRAKGITTQTFIEGRSGTRGMGPEVWRLLRLLMSPIETTSLKTHAGRWQQDLGDGAEDSCVTRTIDELQDDSPLPACWEHGDFVPWNIKRSFDECSLIDWEDARRNSLPLQDAFHFLHMQDFLFGAQPTLHAKNVCARAHAMGLTPVQCRKLEAAYLVDAFAKCVRQENPKRRPFLLATLTQWQRQAA